jgi:peptidylprolyl isomerase
MALEKGTLIFANYTAKVKDTGEAIETTLEDEAKKLNIFEESRRYEPRLVAVGEGWLISGLDAEVSKLDVGEKKTIELPPEKAFGVRDPTQVRMVPLRKFGERENEVQVGDSVEVDNRVGTVRFIGSGRAQVDFNHRLAGKSIVYDFDVLRKVDTDGEKVKALIDRRLGPEGSKVAFDIADGELKVTVPEDIFLLEGLQIMKKGVSTDVFKFVPDVKAVTFVERFANEKAVEKKAEAKEEAAVPAPPTKPRRKRAAPAAKQTS